MSATSAISRLLAPRRGDVLDTLPDEARELYERGTCSLLEACRFLGLPTRTDNRGHGREQAGSTARSRAQRYLERLDADLYMDRRVPGLPRPLRVERVLDAETKAIIRRPRFASGHYTEIPCSRPNGCAYEVDTHLLIPMVYEEVPWP